MLPNQHEYEQLNYKEGHSVVTLDHVPYRGPHGDAGVTPRPQRRMWTGSRAGDAARPSFLEHRQAFAKQFSPPRTDGNAEAWPRASQDSHASHARRPGCQDAHGRLMLRRALARAARTLGG